MFVRPRGEDVDSLTTSDGTESGSRFTKERAAIAQYVYPATQQLIEILQTRKLIVTMSLMFR
jgi:hypothetical protein